MRLPGSGIALACGGRAKKKDQPPAAMMASVAGVLASDHSKTTFGRLAGEIIGHPWPIDRPCHAEADPSKVNYVKVQVV